MLLTSVEYLNTNLDLYGPVKKAEQECHMLSEEAQRGVRNLRVDFERGGIHLCPEKLDRVNKLNIEICQLCREYNENIVMDPGTVDIYPSSRIPKNLHYLVKPIYSSKSLITKDLSGSRGTLKEKGFRITTDPQTLTSVLQFSSDDEVRKIVYIRGNSVPHANVDALKRLISARHELAQIMGCRSYAEFSVKPNISVSPKVVTSFLLEMSKMVQAKCIEERKLVMKFKREKCSQSDGDLRPWHETYYMTMMASSAYKLNSSFEDTETQSFQGDLGYLYLDLYSREGKYPGCAHFAIKRTRRISQTEYQLPIVVLVFNLSGAWNSSAVSLSHWEVETLFHEFGHALQSLLSRTDYQHFSGTRTVLDFAEIPSNLFELVDNYVNVLGIPPAPSNKLVKSMQGARDMFAATDLQRQIFYALVGEQPLPHTPGNSVPRQHYLNTNLDLYGPVKKAEQECHMLSEEAQRGVRNLRVDFERGGIHLCPEKLDRVNKLNIEICQLCREYNENIVMDPGTVDIYPSSRIPKNLHYLVKPIYSSKSLITKDLSGSRGTLKEKGFRITTDPQTLTSVLQFSSDDEVRKIVYIRGNSVPHANVDALKRLISARHELAQIMGCRSYAEFSVKPNISVSPKVVTSFLLEMSKMVQAKCIEERKLVMKFKREKCSQSDGDLRPWHETYYMTMMASSAYKLNSSFEDTETQSFQGDLGYLYLDLYSREGKYPGCAHFAIKRTRRISQTEYQLPIVVLVFNLSGAWNSSAVSLSHWEVETLFHEFGHALQSLLSRTDYQHFSGTRTVLDFAEIPSNLFEHCSTGEEIPQKLVKSMQGARDMFAATDLQRQIFYALVGEQPLPHTPGNSVPRQHV
ncbi:hypothetical protein JHK85_003456 [Glycine max]|nr:hypothetical protein JHK85_003456 [Glycine max]